MTSKELAIGCRRRLHQLPTTVGEAGALLKHAVKAPYRLWAGRMQGAFVFLCCPLCLVLFTRIELLCYALLGWQHGTMFRSLCRVTSLLAVWFGESRHRYQLLALLGLPQLVATAVGRGVVCSTPTVCKQCSWLKSAPCKAKQALTQTYLLITALS
jgi:hypothetical protein